MKRKRPSRLMRWIIRLCEKLIYRYYEGPDVPPRVTEELKLWAGLNPDADRTAAIGYACCLLEAAYRDGFTRGYEWQERCWQRPAVDPEALAEIQSQSWSLADENWRARRILQAGHDPDDPLAGVSAPDKRAFFEFLLNAQDIRVVPRIGHQDGDNE